jgi:site-specific DNA-methyltransferase (adenine-specific)
MMIKKQKVHSGFVSPNIGNTPVMGSTVSIREIEGINRVHHLNFLNNTLPDKCANLIIADPPYFEVKGAFDFVWEDMKAYLLDVEKWAKECKRLLADNGTLFWYGHAKNIAYAQVILDQYFDLQNHIKWRKTDCQTRKGYDNYRIFPPVTEHILMYSQEEYNLTQCIFHIRDYIRAEIMKSKGKISFKDINSTLGTATNGGGVASACLSLDKAEPTMITKEMYEKLQNWCSPHLEKEYELLRAEYELLRRPFDNFMRMEDVWDFAQDVHITVNYDHPTKKTEKLATTMIKSTTNQKDLVVIPFAGSGTECAMSAKDNRSFIAYDTELKYVEMSNNRVLEILRKPELFR